MYGVDRNIHRFVCPTARYWVQFAYYGLDDEPSVS